MGHAHTAEHAGRRERFRARRLSGRGHRAAVGFAAAFTATLSAGVALAQAEPFLKPFKANPPAIATTVPHNGDVNPYGIVVVPRSVGSLHHGALLISNFNAKSNSQGTGTTIVQIPAGGRRGDAGSASVFAKLEPGQLHGACPGGVGLTTALAVTPQGFVIVGSLPTSDGTAATAQAGCLIVLNSQGRALETISGGPINGPWDMTGVTHGDITTLYVTNVLGGTVEHSPDVVDRGTVVRIELRTVRDRVPEVLSERVIANGFRQRTDPAALVIGPTGVALSRTGTLFVADALDNRIAAVPDAATRMSALRGGGRTVSEGGALNAPLGLTIAPNGDILTANGGNGNIVETTPAGNQVAVKGADEAGGAGVLFGLVVAPEGRGLYFVDDGDNTLRLLRP
jgi:hypothetical protein